MTELSNEQRRILESMSDSVALQREDPFADDNPMPQQEEEERQEHNSLLDALNDTPAPSREVIQQSEQPVAVNNTDTTPNEEPQDNGFSMEEMQEMMLGGSEVESVVAIHEQIVDDGNDTNGDTDNDTNNDTNIEEADAVEITDEDEQRELSEEEKKRFVNDPYLPYNKHSVIEDSDTTARFSSAEWFHNLQSKDITFIGAGGISSWTELLVAKIKPHRITIYDGDTVEAVNVAGQLYKMSDIGSAKVDAIADTMREYADYYDIYAIPEYFNYASPASDIMISGLDNMDARKKVFAAWKKRVNGHSTVDKAKCLFIDGRLEAESLQVFCIEGCNDWEIKEYEEKYLFDDSEAAETVCSYKQTAFMANMIAGVITNLLVNFAANEIGSMRALPFRTYYDAISMIFRTLDE